MKRLSIIICTLYLMLLPFGLTACGTTEAKVTGIMAGIGTERITRLYMATRLKITKQLRKTIIFCRSVKVIFWA